MALIDDAPRSATAVAAGDVKLVPVGQKQFLFLVQPDTFFALNVMRVFGIAGCARRTTRADGQKGGARRRSRDRRNRYSDFGFLVLAGDDFCNVWHLFDLIAKAQSGWLPKFGYAD